MRHQIALTALAFLTGSAAFSATITCTSTFDPVPGTIVIQADDLDNRATVTSDGSTASATQFAITPEVQTYLETQQCPGAGLPKFPLNTRFVKVGQGFDDPGMALIVSGAQSWVIIPDLGCGQSASCVQNR